MRSYPRTCLVCGDETTPYYCATCGAPKDRMPVGPARELAEALVKREGSLSAAARVYAKRHQITHSAAWRQLDRILKGAKFVDYNTWDRLWVMT